MSVPIISQYREMFGMFINPILSFSGTDYITSGWAIGSLTDPKKGKRLRGKYLYVPRDGEDAFKIKDVSDRIAFNPFKYKEHLYILVDMLLKKLDHINRDVNSEVELDLEGNLVTIVKIRRRSPRKEDNLPIDFQGVIYETVIPPTTKEMEEEQERLDSGEIKSDNGSSGEYSCVNEEVIWKQIDYNGDDIYCIILLMLHTIEVSEPRARNLPSDARIINYIKAAEMQKDLEYEAAKAKHVKYSSNVNMSQSAESAELLLDDNGCIVDNDSFGDNTFSDGYIEPIGVTGDSSMDTVTFC